MVHLGKFMRYALLYVIFRTPNKTVMYTFSVLHFSILAKSQNFCVFWGFCVYFPSVVQKWVRPKGLKNFLCVFPFTSLFMNKNQLKWQKYLFLTFIFFVLNSFFPLVGRSIFTFIESEYWLRHCLSKEFFQLFLHRMP